MFDAAAERWLDQYLAPLTQASAEPARRLSECSLMSDADRAALARWNDTALAPVGPQLADECVLGGCAPLERRAARRRHQQRLQRPRARSRAWHASPRRCAAAACSAASASVRAPPRGIDMVAAMLATWRCGAAYVPLDPPTRWRGWPTWPPTRRCAAGGDARTAQRAARHDGAPRLRCPAGGRRRARRRPTRSARRKIPPYLIYLGLDRRAKGVVVLHRAVVNFLHSMAHEPGAWTRATACFAVTTLSFDIAVLELLLPLMRGAELVLASAEQALDAAALQRLMREHRITAIQATPSTWCMLLDAGWAGQRVAAR